MSVESSQTQAVENKDAVQDAQELQAVENKDAVQDAQEPQAVENKDAVQEAQASENKEENALKSSSIPQVVDNEQLFQDTPEPVVDRETVQDSTEQKVAICPLNPVVLPKPFSAACICNFNSDNTKKRIREDDSTPIESEPALKKIECY